MNLTTEHRALFCLLRAGLWERKIDDFSPFPLTEAEWKNVHRMAVRQTVTGFVFRGLDYLPEDLLPNDMLMMRWVASVDSIEQRNQKMNAVLGSLQQAMAQNDLHPVLLKGQGVAAFYEFPLLRECGDIDLYFSSEKEERKAAELMRQTGHLVEKHADGSNNYSCAGIEIEHHTQLFDLYNPLLKGFLSKLIKKHGFSNRQIGENLSVSVPSSLLNLLALNSHLLKHMMGHGIGLRQFCDMARAYYSLYGSYSAEELEAVYKRTGLLKWSKQLHTFLTEFLGLNNKVLPFTNTDNETSPALLHIVLEGGNFGQYGDTKGEASQTKWKRKMRTFFSFWKRRDFSNTYARKEAFWTSVKLIIGNLK